MRGPLSPRERAGVRGKGAIGLLYRVKTSFAPQTTFQILVALGGDACATGHKRLKNHVGLMRELVLNVLGTERPVTDWTTQTTTAENAG